jgi:hypothetical protein
MLKPDELHGIIRRLAPAAEGLSLEKVVVRGRLPQGNGELKEMILDISNPAGGGLRIRFREPSEQPIRPLSNYSKKVVKLQRRGLVYPYELLKMITPKNDGTQAEFPTGELVEYDFDQNNQLAPVQRPYGQNKANIVVGVIRNFTNKYPEGMSRVILVGDPSIGMGSLAEPECRRIIAGLDLAEKMRAPWNGSRFLPARKSRWTAAPRTWIGLRGCCGAWWSSRKPAAKSTLSSPASTSARSRIGMPKRRC